MLFAVVALLLVAAAAAATDGVVIEVTKEVECTRKSKKGDTLKMHYTGTLKDGGKKFDSSRDRGSPFSFTLGTGSVIKCWDEGTLAMCPGDKRLLSCSPSVAYGSRSMGPIPGNSHLIFDIELVAIEGIKSEL